MKKYKITINKLLFYCVTIYFIINYSGTKKKKTFFELAYTLQNLKFPIVIQQSYISR